MKLEKEFEVIIVGAGVSGSFIAHALTSAGLRCLLLEAGRSFDRESYPRNELDANSQLYWSGGIEMNRSGDIGFLRPKVVGGGSVVNQALVDRFDENAFDSWRKKSGVSWFTGAELAPWYEKAESEITIQTIPENYRNRNAHIFEEGFRKNGYQCAPLRRAQRDCRYEEGNDCIECLAGCPIDSKQSMPVTVLKKARATGLLTLLPEFEVTCVSEDTSINRAHAQIKVTGSTRGGETRHFLGAKLVLASGAIGNSKLLLRSGMGEKLRALGTGFYTHPQYMNLALYDEPVRAHKGAFQAFKSADPTFREMGFKLENVFAPPVGLAMLIPGYGKSHQEVMRKLSHLACIEVAVRDTEPGVITLNSKGQAIIKKDLNAEDRKRRDSGLEAVNRIFNSTGAKKIIPGKVAIGLHLMGGCAIGTDPTRSVTAPDFRLHGSKRVFVADSSIFPDAPGINPSLTIMALSLKASEEIRR
jgi:choline dehydrogenase-like flavoprotein